MSFQFKMDSLNVTVTLENKRHIKHCYLRVLDPNRVQIRANIYFSIDDAKELIERKKDWIIKQLKRVEKKSLDTDEFLYLGHVKNKSDFNIIDVDKYYKEKIQDFLPSLLDKYSKEMNLFPTSIKYRKNKRTWGSCNYKNGLNFNILLMKFPLEVMEYVIIHELAHIKHKNHSKKFWDLVEFYCPDYKQRENLLKSFL